MMDERVIAAVLLVSFVASSHGRVATAATTNKYDKNYWAMAGKIDLEETLKVQKSLNWNVAKNLILVIGDGMGVTTTTAARIYKGYKDPNLVDAEALLTWDKFPHTGFSKTYNTNYIVTGSAASATAYHCGVKTKQGVVGLDDTLSNYGECDDSFNEAKVSSVLNWAMAEGKSVGIVTTDSLAGGSPSPLYAHSPDRDWKHEIPKEQAGKGCVDIAAQLIDNNRNINVLLGGGRESFFGKMTPDIIDPSINGSRADERNLIEEWKTKKAGKKAQFVKNYDELDAVDPANTDYLFGLFAMERMQEEVTRKVNQTEPSVAQMVKMALKILSRNEKGYYLFVEGANIDVGHHQNRARKALEETLALDKAVKVIKDNTNTDDTLVAVSADHSHAFAFSGYTNRGNSVLGLSKLKGKLQEDKDDNPYPLLTYGNGPSAGNSIANFTEDMFEVDRLYPSIFRLKSEKHGGEDVAIYASGPLSHLFTGTHEQTYIADVFAYAACLNGKTTHCDEQDKGSRAAISTPYISIIILTVCSLLLK